MSVAGGAINQLRETSFENYRAASDAPTDGGRGQINPFSRAASSVSSAARVTGRA